MKESTRRSDERYIDDGEQFRITSERLEYKKSMIEDESMSMKEIQIRVLKYERETVVE